MPSKEYLEAILEKVKEALSPAEWQDLNRAAIPKAGGRASWSSTSGRFRLAELKGELLRSAKDAELGAIWNKLEKWHARTEDKEPFERAASHVLQELLARKLAVEPGDLEAGARKHGSLAKRLEGLPAMVVFEEGAVRLSKSEGGAAMVSAGGEVLGELLGAELLQGDGTDPVPVYDMALVRSDCRPATMNKSANGWLVFNPEVEPEQRAVKVGKSADEKQIIYYVVSEPDSTDAHGEKISADTIEEALHKYMISERAVRLEHEKEITGRAEVVEGYVAPCDLETFHGQKPGSGTVKAGSSIVAIRYTDKALWDELKKSDHGISWGGEAKRVRT